MEELYGCFFFLRRVFNCTISLFLSIRIYMMLGFILTSSYVCIICIAFICLFIYLTESVAQDLELAVLFLSQSSKWWSSMCLPPHSSSIHLMILFLVFFCISVIAYSALVAYINPYYFCGTKIEIACCFSIGICSK